MGNILLYVGHCFYLQFSKKSKTLECVSVKSG